LRPDDSVDISVDSLEKDAGQILLVVMNFLSIIDYYLPINVQISGSFSAGQMPSLSGWIAIVCGVTKLFDPMTSSRETSACQ